MKFVFAMVSLLVSSYGFAHHDDIHTGFEGHGHLVGADGVEMDYDVHIDSYWFGDHLDLVESYRLNGVEETFNFTVLMKDHGFGDIYKDGNKIGWGYCFKKEGMKLCHHTYTYDGWTVEKTCHFKDGFLKRVGSAVGDDKVFRFIDKSRKIGHPDQEPPHEDPTHPDHPGDCPHQHPEHPRDCPHQHPDHPEPRSNILFL